MESGLLLVVGGLWGALTLFLLLRIGMFVREVQSANIGKDAALSALREEVERRKLAEQNLNEARAIFMEQLRRPVLALFNEEQVISLSKRLAELLFPKAGRPN